MRHPHYDVIVAFAEGKPVQYYSTLHKSWLTYGPRDNAPSFNPTGQFRVKPETLKYRVYLYRISSGSYIAVSAQAGTYDTHRRQGGFVRWLGEEQEVEA